jgi:hypothetical protein
MGRFQDRHTPCRGRPIGFLLRADEHQYRVLQLLHPLDNTRLQVMNYEQHGRIQAVDEVRRLGRINTVRRVRGAGPAAQA